MDTAVLSFSTASTVLPFPAMPVLATGEFLETGGVYFDLARPERGPFVAIAGQVAGSGNRYIAKRDLSCPRWWRLVKSAAHGPFTIEDPRPMPRPAAADTAIWFAADETALTAAAP